jgi:hypothetical protein
MNIEPYTPKAVSLPALIEAYAYYTVVLDVPAAALLTRHGQRTRSC